MSPSFVIALFDSTRLLHTSFVSLPGMIARFIFASCFATGLTLTALNLTVPRAVAQGVETDVSNLRSLARDSSILNIQTGQKLAKEGTDAYNAGNYAVAVQKLQEARQVFNQLSNFHQELVGSFAGLDSRIAASARTSALKSAQARDESTYDLARAHRAQKQADLAVPLLIQVLKSQQPGRPMGQKAYAELLAIGFTDMPFPSPKEANPQGSRPKNLPQASTPQPSTPQPSTPQPSPQAAPELALLSLNGGNGLMTEAASAVSAGNYPLAQSKLKDARKIFNQISNFYQDLSTVFAGLDTPIANSTRDKAVESAQKRDESTYQLALVHRAQNQPELSVPLLVQVLKSQQATRELGKKAYAQLFELGFADVEYPRKAGK